MRTEMRYTLKQYVYSKRKYNFVKMSIHHILYKIYHIKALKCQHFMFLCIKNISLNKNSHIISVKHKKLYILRFQKMSWNRHENLNDVMVTLLQC